MLLAYHSKPVEMEAATCMVTLYELPLVHMCNIIVQHNSDPVTPDAATTDANISKIQLRCSADLHID